MNRIGHSQNIKWPKGPVSWIENRILYISIPFTWNLPKIKDMVESPGLFWDRAIVGGPAVCLMPEYFSDLPHVEWSVYHHGILQRINPLATRTTLGCPNNCKFCGVDKFEPRFIELKDWPDLPIICDNNLLAASQKHFDKVIDRLVKWGWCDFNQGLDASLLADHHAKRIAEIKGPKKRGIRLALDKFTYKEIWSRAFDRLRSAGIAKRNISSYALIGYDSDPSEAWARCQWIESHGIRALPMWFHELDAMEYNIVTEKQKRLGWTDDERKRIMQYFYQHREYPRKNNDCQRETIYSFFQEQAERYK